MWEWFLNYIKENMEILKKIPGPIIIIFIMMFCLTGYLQGLRYEDRIKNKDAVIERLKENQSLGIDKNAELKTVILSSNAIRLSGPGRYLINTENNEKVAYLRRIYGLSLGDIVELRTSSDDLDIIVEPSDYLKMAFLFHLNNKYDKLSFTCDGNDICVENYRVSNWSKKDNE